MLSSHPLERIERLVFSRTGLHLTEPQRALLSAAWSPDRQSYEQTAEQVGYSANYLKKHVGPELWKLLSGALGEKVSKVNLRSVLDRHTQDASPSCRQDWGESVSVERFYGRDPELAQLSQWILADRCRLIALLGVGGIGKTYLSLHLAQQIAGHFEVVIWRSLQTAPTLVELLTDLLHHVSAQPEFPAQDPQTLMTKVIDFFRSTRCLLILDNMETLMQGASRAGDYRDGYASFGDFLQKLGEGQHQSCLLLTSREKPREFAWLEGETLPVRSLRLKGLSVESGQQILRSRGLLSTSPEQTRILVERLGGNPLALKIASSTLHDLFAGNVAEFLQQETTLSHEISELLEQQFCRLPPLERSILYWLTLRQESLSIHDLHDIIFPPAPHHHVLEGLRSLGQRSLLESRSENGLCRFDLQPVVKEYVLEKFLQLAVQEIQEQQFFLLNQHALLKAQAKDSIREIQTRLLLHPLAQRLSAIVGSQRDLQLTLGQILQDQRTQYPHKSGYLAGNLFNLLRHLNPDLSGYDFSRLSLWQVCLDGVQLNQANLAHTELKGSALTEAFSSTLSVAFSPDGQSFATATTDNQICLWQVSSGQKVQVLHGHIGWVHAVAFSPDGSLLASASEDQTVKVWDLSSGQCRQTLRGHRDWVWSVAFHPQGQWVASGSHDQTVRVWDLDSGACLHSLRGHTGWVWSVAFSPDGSQLASGSTDHTIQLWDSCTGQRLRILSGHSHWVQAVVYIPAPYPALASSGSDNTIRLWDPHSGECLKILGGHRNWVQSLSYDPTRQQLASGSNDQSIKLWDVTSGQCLKTLQGLTRDIWAVSFSPDGATLLSGGTDQTIHLWDVDTGQCLNTWHGHLSGVLCLASSPLQPLLASGSSDRLIRLWDLNSGRCVRSLPGHSSWVRSVAFSPDGLLLASGGSDHLIRVWDPHQGQCLQTLPGHDSWVRAVAFSPRPGPLRLASGSTDQTIKLWDPYRGECLNTLRGHDSWVRALAWSPCGSWLASSGDDQTIRLWDPDSGNCLAILAGHRGGIWSVAFSPDGSLLASGGDDHEIRLWQVQTGRCLQVLTGHLDWIQSVAFRPSPEGSLLLASGSNDRTVKLWDVARGECVTSLSGHQHRIWSVTFSADGKTLMTGSEDETVKLWDPQSGLCRGILRAVRPYEGMDITGISGLSDLQRATLKVLGAKESIELHTE